MIVLTALLIIQAADMPAHCSREAVEQAHLANLKPLKARIDKLFEERRGLLAKRSDLAKRSVKLAEMSSVKRELSETFGPSQEGLERLDRAYTARLNTIADEASGIRGELKAGQNQYDFDLRKCGIKVDNAQD